MYASCIIKYIGFGKPENFCGKDVEIKSNDDKLDF